MRRLRRLAARVALVGCFALLAAVPAAADDLARGEVLFQVCSSCHGADGLGNESLRAPSIAGLGQWYVESQLYKYRTGIRGAHPEDVEGLRMRPMSRYLDSDEDVKAVAAYVASMSQAEPPESLAGGDPARGQQLYATCGACHGQAAEGNQQTFGPALNKQQDWYMLTQLQKFKSGIRGGNPQDTTGIMMRPMAMALTDEQAMRDVIAYILTLE